MPKMKDRMWKIAKIQNPAIGTLGDVELFGVIRAEKRDDNSTKIAYSVKFFLWRRKVKKELAAHHPGLHNTEYPATLSSQQHQNKN